MIGFDLAQYWQIAAAPRDLAPGSYTVLCGLADQGPTLLAVPVSDLAQARAVFGPSNLSREYRDFLANGGTTAFLVRLDGAHYSYGLQGLLSLHTASGLGADPSFSYSVTSGSTGQFLRVSLDGRETAFPVTGLGIQSLVQSINSQSLLNRLGYYASFLGEGYLQNGSSSADDLDLDLAGLRHPDEAVSVWPVLAELLAGCAPSCVALGGVSFAAARASRWELLGLVSASLAGELAGNIPTVCLLGHTGSLGEMIELSGSLYSYIVDNQGEVNSYSETLAMDAENSRIVLRHGHLTSYQLYLVDESGRRQPYAGDYAIDENYGIIELSGNPVSAVNLELNYTVARVVLPKLLTVVYDPGLDSTGQVLTNGTGRLAGKLAASGLDGTIRFSSLDYGELYPAPVPAAESVMLRQAHIIHPQAVTLGRSRYGQYVNDKTLANLTDGGLISSLANANLLTAIAADLAALLGRLFKDRAPAAISRIDVLVQQTLQAYQNYLSRYDYRVGHITDVQSLTRQYLLEVDLYLDGQAEKLVIGYTL
jgi:hypothetical protein